MKKGLCNSVDVINGSDGISASPVTTFPNSGWTSLECSLLKAPAFALARWIRKTIMSAAC